MKIFASGWTISIFPSAQFAQAARWPNQTRKTALAIRFPPVAAAYGRKALFVVPEAVSTDTIPSPKSLTKGEQEPIIHSDLRIC
jgi:hypothetical protein